VTLVRDGWAALRRYTPARVGLGRTGVSLPTERHLELQEALARARDAVHAEFDARALAAELRAAGMGTIELRSAAPDRATYLRRPDLGRRLAPTSRAALAEGQSDEVDLALVVADGLSATAVGRHSAALLHALRDLLPLNSWRLGPVALVHQGRVAVGDEVAEVLCARAVAVLIGERPGLSAADSLGVYVTWEPRVGSRDAQRNCISNIRAEGLSVGDGARSLAALLGAARAHQCSGIALSQVLAAFAPQVDGKLLGQQ
jgi:ethanolamine ammonia-lyase small subunit